jgi:hypothetical protein
MFKAAPPALKMRLKRELIPARFFRKQPVLLPCAPGA